MPDMDGYEVAKRLRANPLLAGIPILMFTAKTQLDDKVTGFEAGADDYLTKPTHPTELNAHVKALLSRSTKGKGAAPAAPVEKRAYTIGVLAARGGLGVTTTAVNLGCALHKAGNEEVVVAELRPGMGTLGPDFGQPHPRQLTELLQTPTSDLTRQKVKDAFQVHETGLMLLYGSVQPKDGILLKSIEPFEALVNRMSYLGRYLVLDLGSGLPPITQKLVTACHMLIVVVEPVMNTIIHSRALITDLADLGFNKRTIQAVVVNRVRSEMQVNWTQIEETLGQTPLVAITPAPELISMAARQKTTVVLSDPEGLTTQQFAKLAASILDIEKQQL